MNVSTPSRLQDLHLPEMPDRPSIDLPDFEMPDIDDLEDRHPEGRDRGRHHGRYGRRPHQARPALAGPMRLEPLCCWPPVP